MTDAALLDRFRAIVGARNVVTEKADQGRYLNDTRGLYFGQSPAIVKPATTEEVSAILKLASETGTPIVPQGGNTGHVAGQVPREGLEDIVLSLERMNRIRDIDPVGNVLVAEAGAVLADIHAAAEKIDRLFPLSLGSQGTAQIGGNLSTNAGGTAVLAYGNMRQLCLGLEVVLPTGEVWNGLRRLKKDNTGYDLRDLFIGAEGTLGVITAAVLKLFPRPAGHQVAIAGLADPEAALKLFSVATRLGGPALTGFEIMARIGVEFTVRHMPGVREPMGEPHPWYVLIDISTANSEESAEQVIHAILEEAFEAGLVADAVIAQNDTQRRAFWTMRESMSLAQKPEGGSIKHDVSVPVSAIPSFLAQADAAVERMVPGARICAFGHMGDGNIHYNISQPVGADTRAFLDRWHEVSDVVHGIVRAHDGSISAEHGIGQLKRDELAAIREPIEIDLMHRIKAAFDPAGIMNPDKVLQIRR